MAGKQGAVKLNNDRKARILAKKDAQTSTHKKIAEEENVSRETVARITSETVSPEVIDLSKQYQLKMVDNLKNLAMLGVENSIKKINSSNAKDSMIVAATAIDKVQLLTNQPTSIVSQVTDADIAREVFKRLIEKYQWSKEEAVEAIKEDYPEVDVKLLTE